MTCLSLYYHRQRGPLCLVLYGLAVAFFVIAWFVRTVPPQSFLSLIFALAGLVLLILAAGFHHLTVADEIDRLRICFGPLPLFQRSVLYEDVLRADVDRTTIFEGWGIHLSPRGGWVWNLWGRDCVTFQMKTGTLRVGTDDAENLAAFVNSRVEEFGVDARDR
ncbi:hypothetical protein [Gimesia sp.]|uniref:hypothetical protein n=1 Tax=Gimesia sp. TaxID=2024833 RepID=UPI000C61CFBB|nr:hypothetical protein [Gimesia sp.]MAX36330.1 hypothetical protein [Gimesia sp.]HAH49060.1 hypothetical protein [Planctomycetaceae bacterium]HBL45116.1 hypothetical protein [Planctomycetaceae bacterium]|tara:strand:+ start:3262 stop:3750 length:489 start_codon:yes stop_codon:yes gene_type:complete